MEAAKITMDPESPVLLALNQVEEQLFLRKMAGF